MTGSASTGEHFNKGFEVPNDGSQKIGETCVTMCWIYLSLNLGRLTGEARFFDAIEQAVYNHLLAAQSPDGRGWAYYVGLRDAKRYARHTDPECCPNRGTRALCLTPGAAFGIDEEGVVVNLYEPSDAELELSTGERVSLAVDTKYPFEGFVRIEVRPDRAQSFAVRLRLPAWCDESTIHVGGESIRPEQDSRGYVVVRREWRRGDIIEIEFAMPVRVVLDALGNRGRAALTRGPLVYAVDTSYLPEGHLLDDVTFLIDSSNPSKGMELLECDGSVHLIAPRAWTLSDGLPMWGAGRYRSLDERAARTEVSTVRLVPFFEAGNRDPRCYFDGVRSFFELNPQPATYQVWTPLIWA